MEAFCLAPPPPPAAGAGLATRVRVARPTPPLSHICLVGLDAGGLLPCPIAPKGTPCCARWRHWACYPTRPGQATRAPGITPAAPPTQAPHQALGLLEEGSEAVGGGGGLDLFQLHVVAVDPGGGFFERAGHGLGGGGAVQGELAGHQGAALARRIDPADQAAARQQPHDGVV